MTENENRPEGPPLIRREDVSPALRYGPSRCCTHAVRLDCVCQAAWRCNAHGWTWHYGTHD